MRILAIHNIGMKDNSKESAVAIWRIWRPLEELKKHVDWTIDYQRTFIKDIDKYKDMKEFTSEEVEAAGKHLGSYDIVFHSYHADAAADALCEAVTAKYGTKFILDDDDNTFAIDPDNPFWTQMTDDHAFIMQQICRYSKYITTTTDNLKDYFQARTKVDANITVIPNYMSESYKDYMPDNGDRIVIGYFGGSSHYNDLHDTGFLPALQKIMHEHRNVYFKCVGIPIDYYLPRKRILTSEVAYGRQWVTKLFPTLNFDIAVAPLVQTIFAEGKSNIKWLESSRMGAAFIRSNVGPYKPISDDQAIKVENNTTDWYNALKTLVEDKEKRLALVKASKQEIKANWMLEDNWSEYKDLFERVKSS